LVKNMAISATRMAAVRPLLYHLTAASNIAQIRQEGRLVSANRLFERANARHLSGVRRREHHLLQVDGELVVIRDQAPLHKGNMSLDVGWDFSRFVEELNDLVFFWPGTEDGPIPHGRRHYERYADEPVRILRIRTSDALATPLVRPLVCKYNSGSPRWSRGRPSPRGASTFVELSDAPFPASAVVEVAFRRELTLPTCVEVASTPTGPWSPL
jgi:hypothetical protein